MMENLIKTLKSVFKLRRACEATSIRERIKKGMEYIYVIWNEHFQSNYAPFLLFSFFIFWNLAKHHLVQESEGRG